MQERGRFLSLSFSGEGSGRPTACPPRLFPLSEWSLPRRRCEPRSDWGFRCPFSSNAVYSRGNIPRLLDPGGPKATSRPRCQLRVFFAFIEARRRPLTEQAGGLGAGFGRKGRRKELSFWENHFRICHNQNPGTVKSALLPFIGAKRTASGEEWTTSAEQSRIEVR